MYTPHIFKESNQDELINFIQKFNFGILVSASDNFPTATHLPFVVEKRGEELFLIAHFARANEHWQEIENNEKVLVIFSEPHAYISTKHYETELNVPTWNYISVHCYGIGKIISDEKLAYEIMEKSINSFDKEYLEQWHQLPEKYKSGMMKGIVAFEIKITNWQGKKKISQNRTEKEQKNIISHLEKSTSSPEKEIASYMKNNKIL